MAFTSLTTQMQAYTMHNLGRLALPRAKHTHTHTHPDSKHHKSGAQKRTLERQSEALS